MFQLPSDHRYQHHETSYRVSTSPVYQEIMEGGPCECVDTCGNYDSRVMEADEKVSRASSASTIDLPVPCLMDSQQLKANRGNIQRLTRSCHRHKSIVNGDYLRKRSNLRDFDDFANDDDNDSSDTSTAEDDHQERMNRASAIREARKSLASMILNDCGEDDIAAFRMANSNLKLRASFEQQAFYDAWRLKHERCLCCNQSFESDRVYYVDAHHVGGMGGIYSSERLVVEGKCTQLSTIASSMCRRRFLALFPKESAKCVAICCNCHCIITSYADYEYAQKHGLESYAFSKKDWEMPFGIGLVHVPSSGMYSTSEPMNPK